jgi:ACS family tartrate transporter-like MFS transporter
MASSDHSNPTRVTSPITVADAAQEAAVMWKVTLRLIPFLFLLYVLNILDRVNVGFARLSMLSDLKLSETAYGRGAGLFFVGYFLFEVPSNLIMRRMGARRWIARILISWGIISASMMFIRSEWSFYLLRFLLGVAEAGFFPGIILYLSYWFPAQQRARAVARFMTGAAITGIVGNPLSGAIMEYTKDWPVLAGWQWLFLLEGLPTVLVGFIALFYLTDYPHQARWLTSEERAWLAERMSREETYREQRHGFTLYQSLTNPRVWWLCLLYFTVAMGSNSFGLYLPQTIKDQFADRSNFEIGLLGAVPNAAAIVAMVLMATHSDWTGERRWHIALAALVAATGWTMVAQAPYLVSAGLTRVIDIDPNQVTPYLVLAGLTLAQMGMLSMLAPFWSLPASFLSGAAAAGGIAFINSVGNLGGYVAPNVIGQVKDATGSFSGGFMFLAGGLVIGAFLAIGARHDAALERTGQTTS